MTEKWTGQKIVDAAVPVGECLEFQSHWKTRPQVYNNGKLIQAYRLVYLHLNGELAPREPVHHKCANFYCVRPEHLERASQYDNTLEMLGRKAYEAKIAHLESKIAALEAQLEREWETA